jgi:4-amino-4-deoxy-L-arabinose transferase-like glycosyltransferase
MFSTLRSQGTSWRNFRALHVLCGKSNQERLMATLTLPQKPSFLTRKLALGITTAHILLAGIILLSVVLHFSNLEAIGDANTYYTAAVESMLDSWKNFFFVAAEPGGSVTVDKPPLGLWIEAAFAFMLGVQGWAVSLPNMLAGVLSVPLLYHLVRKYMDELAGLVAALVLVVTPVAIATDRNNTMDGMLVFTLLLATWAFIAGTETGRSRWLFLGAFIVGLGFNIKMLQAFLPLPAFYALYFLGSKTGWWQKIVNLGLATVILLLVSLSWAVIVDLTPVAQRPYIGSSEDNTVMELIVGHNGLSRLFGGGGNRPAAGTNAAPDGAGAPGGIPAGDNPQLQGSPPQQALAACAGQIQGQACTFTLRDGKTVSGACITPPGMNQLACAPQGRPVQGGQPSAAARPQPPAGVLGDGPLASPDGPSTGGANGNTPFSRETGSPGIARFFLAPLSKQMSWLLPFALVGLVAMLLAVRLNLPLEPEHKALVLWGGWLLTCLVFFSVVEGIFHAYYAIMLAPALGAVVGGGFGGFWRLESRRPWTAALYVGASILTIAFQIYMAGQYGATPAWLYLPLVLGITATGLMRIPALRRSAYLAVLAAMLAIPMIWTGMTVLDSTPEVNLPTAFDGGGAGQAAGARVPELNEKNPADERLVDYLQANTADVEYLVAVPNAHSGSPLVLATGRPVLYIGGFSGGDQVIDAAGLAGMVANGELRYVLYSAARNDRGDIAGWLNTTCQAVPEFSQSGARQAGGQGQQRPGENQASTLYRCD